MGVGQPALLPITSDRAIRTVCGEYSGSQHMDRAVGAGKAITRADMPRKRQPAENPQERKAPERAKDTEGHMERGNGASAFAGA